jgi:hypothetical protein
MTVTEALAFLNLLLIPIGGYILHIEHRLTRLETLVNGLKK